MTNSTAADCNKHVVTQVRGVNLSLVSYTRALELCARMNYETEVLDFIDEIDADQVLYDLGACEGRFALYAAMRQIRCYAFEPEAANFQAMMENISLNGASVQNFITPVNCAVGSFSGRAKMHVGQPWAGGHHKIVASEAERMDLSFDVVTEQEINIVSLDEYVRSAELPKPNYLKIDVDGSELAVLNGAEDILSTPELKKIIFELCTTDRSYQQVVSRLNRFGFLVGAHHPVPNTSDLFNVVFARRAA
jgi:FkbM family methyltransferase